MKDFLRIEFASGCDGDEVPVTEVQRGIAEYFFLAFALKQDSSCFSAFYLVLQIIEAGVHPRRVKYIVNIEKTFIAGGVERTKDDVAGFVDGVTESLIIIERGRIFVVELLNGGVL